MKEKIVKFFKEDRSYLGAIRLYNEVGNSLSVKKQINLQPEKIMKGILFEQLRILAGISPDDFRLMMAGPIATAQPKPVEKTVEKPATVEGKQKAPAKKAASKKKSPPKK